MKPFLSRSTICHLAFYILCQHQELASICEMQGRCKTIIRQTGPCDDVSFTTAGVRIGFGLGQGLRCTARHVKKNKKTKRTGINLVNASANGERGCRFWLAGLDSGSEWDRAGDFGDEDAGDAGRATRTRSCGEMGSSDVGQGYAGVCEEVIEETLDIFYNNFLSESQV